MHIFDLFNTQKLYLMHKKRLTLGMGFAIIVVLGGFRTAHFIFSLHFGKNVL